MAPICYRFLGDSGLRVAEVALGTMLFGDGEDGTIDARTASRIFDIYRSAGGNLLDTADIFRTGRAEKLLGELIDHDRDAIVVGTKYTFAPRATDPNAGGNHRKHLLQAVEASLRRLRTDRLDLLWVNGWDFMTPEHEVMRALDDLVSAGKVLYLGITNTPAWVISRCNMLAQWRGRSPFVGLQVHYSLADRTAERELLPMARALDLGITVCGPLNGGQLADPGKTRSVFRQSEVVVATYRTDRRSRAIADAVAAVGRENGCTAAQVALAWIRDRGLIPVIGASTPEQMTENLGVFDVTLSTDQATRLERASALGSGHADDVSTTPHDATFDGVHEQPDRHRGRDAAQMR